MPSERYFCESELAKKGQMVELEGAEFHHLARVMRMREGESVELINGRGALAEALVKKIGKEGAVVEVQSVEFQKQGSAAVILAQALPKLSNLDFILEKGTELGATEFWLFPTDKSVKKELFPNQIERMKALLIAAMKQSGRLYLPKIVFKGSLENWAAERWNFAYFGDVRPEAPLFLNELMENSQGESSQIIFFVGPESGFTAKEVDELLRRGVVGVKLHKNILRVETAGLAALSLIEQVLNFA